MTHNLDDEAETLALIVPIPGKTAMPLETHCRNGRKLRHAVVTRQRVLGE